MEIKTEQYYPTYKFNSEKRDVVLIEFEESLKIANSQTKVYGQLTNILLAFVTILLSILLNQNFNPEVSINIFRENSILFSIIIFLFGSFILRYFVDLQKQITINARKAVTLRAMLGLDYGHINLTIPNWRVEGATNPFVIKFFNGWFRFQSVPFWVLTIGVNAIWWISTINQLSFNIQFSENITFVFYQWYGYLIISITYLFVFRTNLNDTHETNFINIVRWFARLINFKLVENFEYIIYRAKLDVIEMSRLKVNYENLKSILVEIEDKTFYSNCGVSFKSLIRATISQIKPLRKKFKLIESGGSTITMQLARSLFINTKQNNFLRKVFEILLAFWINKKFTKEELLNLYVVSVRYDLNVIGLSKAIKHFYTEKIKEKSLSKEESFVLVERLSNVTSSYRVERIDYLLEKLKVEIEKDKVFNIYNSLIDKGKIKK